MHKSFFYNKFIIFLYMFRALLCSSSGAQNCNIQHLVSPHSVGGRPVHMSSSKLCTGRPPSECYDIRCCIIQFDLLMMSTQCSKHVEEYNKLAIKQEFVH